MADQIREFDITYPHENAGQYVEVKFTMPEGVEEFSFSYDYDKVKEHIKDSVDLNMNCIDIALLGPDGRQVGASGSSKTGFVISEVYSTPSYKAVPPVAGVWRIIFGLYLIKTEGVTIHYTLGFTFKRRRWLRGDCHLHTVNSDGKHTPPALISKCQKQGLDWIIITDHNNNVCGTGIPKYPNLLIIPGEELTTYKGHVNMWGVDEPFAGSYAVNDNENMLRLAAEAKANGAILSVNHPHCKKCTWLFPLDDYPMDCVEVWNGPMRIDNMSTISWWHEMLKAGKHIGAVGGSDYHMDYVITDLLAEPTTVVLADSLSQSDILSALTAGRAYITKHPNKTVLYISSGDAVMGETVKLTADTKVQLHAEKLKRGARLVIYNNDTIIYDQKVRSKNLDLDLPVTEKGFVRAELRYQKKGLSALAHRLALKFMLPEEAKEPIPEFMWALTNPVWFE